ncbi:hypothetical protein D3C85_855480 [compost metagenome]
MSRLQPEACSCAPSGLFGSSKVQLLRPSARRLTLARGPPSSMRGMLNCCQSNGSGATRNSTRCRLTKSPPLAHSGLPRCNSSATKWGQGTNARQPPSPASRCQITCRSPSMAKGRPSSADTRSFSAGLMRFQSKVATSTNKAASSSASASTVLARMRRPRVMHFSPFPTTASARAVCCPFPIDPEKPRDTQIRRRATRGRGRKRTGNIAQGLEYEGGWTTSTAVMFAIASDHFLISTRSVRLAPYPVSSPPEEPRS